MEIVKKEQAIESALMGLDFMARCQITESRDANCGRFVYLFDCVNSKPLVYTTNWTTGVCAEAMLAGHKLTGKETYLNAAEHAVKYLASLQFYDPGNDRMHGVIREITPQTSWAHPRDALTAAWAMLDFSQHAGREEYLHRSLLFAKWFLDVALEKGYPFWTVRLDDEPWFPHWFGSFQSGGAFYFYRLYHVTRDSKYKEALFRILDHYNKYHLENDGKIHVTVDRETLKPVTGYIADPKYSNQGWEIMHEYNDDFGALANLAAYNLCKDEKYLQAAKCFLQRMLRIQREDGGFGPDEYSVPNAGGTVLLELMAAQKLGYPLASLEQLSRIARYIMNLQFQDADNPARGAFRGFNESYVVSDFFNARTGAYSVMGLLRYAGAADPFYFFDGENSDIPAKK
ncbi:hypothetical protein JW926_03035 [Candidatus Sumerlaeota bacterium]|nr:hypothetical protein [Candidatus Sumerlaeota bacterium]